MGKARSVSGSPLGSLRTISMTGTIRALPEPPSSASTRGARSGRASTSTRRNGLRVVTWPWSALRASSRSTTPSHKRRRSKRAVMPSRALRPPRTAFKKEPVVGGVSAVEAEDHLGLSREAKLVARSLLDPGRILLETPHLGTQLPDLVAEPRHLE